MQSSLKLKKSKNSNFNFKDRFSPVLQSHFLLLILSLSFFCSEPKSKETVPEKPIEGWAGSPVNPSQKPFEYFYMAKKAKVNVESPNKQKARMIQSTCVDVAITQAKRDLIRTLFEDTFASASTTAGQEIEFNTKAVIREFSGLLKDVKTKECKPKAIAIADYPASEWVECECVIFVHIPGGKDTVITRFQQSEQE
ncbi:MAG: hypothetical protein SFU98_06385 [Leptospiraceae bacterium]|nr:hypothetical protein [Leptospiraceae bacterium]